MWLRLILAGGAVSLVLAALALHLHALSELDTARERVTELTQQRNLLAAENERQVRTMAAERRAVQTADQTRSDGETQIQERIVERTITVTQERERDPDLATCLDYELPASLLWDTP